ncbi:hypothetical protein R4B61_01640 [Fructilactobacillus vespulae]|uniref:hypothetical protein n=1 Tax=Fructilactobacillus vespulae TaxID=1249630 RepID=UPI0039B5ED69
MKKKEILLSFLILLVVVLGSSFYIANQNNQTSSDSTEKVATDNDNGKNDEIADKQVTSIGKEQPAKIKNSKAAVAFLRDRLGNNVNFDYEVVESNNEFYKVKVISKAAKEHGNASTVGVYNVMPDESYGLAF